MINFSIMHYASSSSRVADLCLQKKCHRNAKNAKEVDSDSIKARRVVYSVPGLKISALPKCAACMDLDIHRRCHASLPCCQEDYHEPGQSRGASWRPISHLPSYQDGGRSSLGSSNRHATGKTEKEKEKQNENPTKCST